ncbi:MAG: ribonuclease H [Bradymonadales bacterium]
MKRDDMRYLRMMFKRKNKVYVPVDEFSQPIVNNGLISYKYRRDDAKFFTAKASNLEYIPGELPREISEDTPKPKPKSKKTSPAPSAVLSADELVLPKLSDDELPPVNTILVYTDGGASPNPGPAAAAFVMLYGKHVLEYWEYLGEATNNVGELTAILRALEQIKNKELPIALYSDSNYAIGVSTAAMKAKQNLELVGEIREQLKLCPRARLNKVKAHVGIPLNEHVDSLVGLARDSRTSGQRRSSLD